MEGPVGCTFNLTKGMYMFLAPNGQAIPVFGRCPKESFVFDAEVLVTMYRSIQRMKSCVKKTLCIRRVGQKPAQIMHIPI